VWCSHTIKSVLLLSLRAMLPNWEETNSTRSDWGVNGQGRFGEEKTKTVRFTRENTGKESFECVWFSFA
ncbi:hypothetical protein AB1K70_00005, partial [Bremerella sp. JC770]|uniref:hypothetical protein n=1 Tax=Bremerella sp. JC770 TaxID=3232137 RepID=UPI00345B12A9